MADQQQAPAKGAAPAAPRPRKKPGPKPGRTRGQRSDRSDSDTDFGLDIEVALSRQLMRVNGKRAAGLEIIARSLDEDVETRYRSTMRQVRFLCRADVVRGPNGAPLTDNGKKVTLTILEQVIHAMARAAINSQHPQQKEMAELLMQYAVGIPVKNLQFTGPQGGPLQTHTTHEVAPVIMSDEEKASRILASVRMAQEVAQRTQGQRAISGVEVRAPTLPGSPAQSGVVIEAQASNSPVPTAAGPTPPPVAPPRGPMGMAGSLPGNLVAPSVAGPIGVKRP